MIKDTLRLRRGVTYPAVAVVASLGWAGGPRSAAAELTQVRTVEGISEYTLPNGLQVLLFPDPTQSNVTVNITYRVGSRHEGRGEAGMAHLLEHMVFKGTPTYDDIWGELEAHGATPFNGTTWVDRTNYYETLPATEENIRFALHMEADRMINSHIAKEELDKEMTVVRNEFEMGENNPIHVLWDRIYSMAYLWHNYGKSTIGNRSDIERVPVESLRAFYKKYYQPDNAALVVAGKFDETLVKNLINEYFGAIPKPERTLDATYTVEPAQDGPRSVTLRRVGDVAAAGVAYHVPASLHSDFPACQVLDEILTAEPSGRVYQALVPTGLASGVMGVTFNWKEPGLSLVLSESRETQDPEAALSAMIQVTEGFADAPVTQQEVDRAKNRILKDIKLALTNSERIGIQLSEWIAIGDWRMMFVHRDRLKEVTAEDVQRVATTYFAEENRTSGIYLPTERAARAEIPSTPDITDVVGDYQGSETIALGEIFEATPQNIDQRTERLDIAPTIKAALLYKETRGKAVRARIQLRFGSEEAMAKGRHALDLLPKLMERGTQDLDFAGLRDRIDALESRISLSGGAGKMTATIESDRDNLAAAIQLAGAMLRTPALDAEQFKILQKEELTGLEYGLSDPEQRTRNQTARAARPFPADSFHYVPTIEEKIAIVEGLGAEDLQAAHAKFVGASNTEVAVVGDFDRGAIVETLTETFGDWSSPAAYERVVRPHVAVQSGTETYAIPDKESAVIAMVTTLPLRDDDPDYAALAIGNFILGESASSRLLNSLRHDGALSYYAGSHLDVDAVHNASRLSAFAICAPQNAGEARNTMREQVQRWIADGITAEELTEAKQGYAAQYDGYLSKDRVVVRWLANQLEIDRTFEYLVDHLKQVDSLSPEQVNAAVEKHVAGLEWFDVAVGNLSAEPVASGSH